MIEYTVKDRNALCEIINLQEGISRFAGKESLYFKSLLKFINDYRDVPSPENEEEYRRYAHTVKGLSGNLGFKKLYELNAATKESYNKQNAVDFIPQMPQETTERQKTKKPNISLEPEQQRVFDNITKEPIPINQLAQISDLPIHELMSILTMLEIKGVVSLVSGQRVKIIERGI